MTDEQIRNAVCSYFGIPMTDIASQSRRADVVQARSAYCAILRRNKGTLSGIGRLVGGRDHSTVRRLIEIGNLLPLDNILNFVDLKPTSLEQKAEEWCYERFLDWDTVRTSKYPSVKVHRNKLWRYLSDLNYTQRDIALLFGVTPAAGCEQLRRMAKRVEVPSKPKRRANNMLRPGAKVWWADHDATVIEDYGQTVKLWSYGDVYGPVSKSEVIER